MYLFLTVQKKQQVKRILTNWVNVFIFNSEKWTTWDYRYYPKPESKTPIEFSFIPCMTFSFSVRNWSYILHSCTYFNIVAHLYLPNLYEKEKIMMIMIIIRLKYLPIEWRTSLVCVFIMQRTVYWWTVPRLSFNGYTRDPFGSSVI